MPKKTDEKDAKTPMDLHYMQSLRRDLHFFNSWPYKVFGENRGALPLRNNKFMFCLWCCLLITGVLYIKRNLGVISFFEIGHSYITIFMNVVSLQRVSMAWTKGYQQVTKDFVLTMHLFHFKNKSEYFSKTNDRVHKICRIVTFILQLQVILGTIFFNIMPLYNNFRAGLLSGSRDRANGTYEHAVYYELPFDCRTNFYGYLVVAIANIFFSFDCGSCCCIYDLYVSVIVFHIWGHLKILGYNLRHFPHPESSKQSTETEVLSYTEEESIMVGNLLKDNINHHKLIMEFLENTLDAFGPSLCLYLLFHQVSGCILLLECSRMDSASLIKYGTLTAVMFQQLIQISVIVELLDSQSQILKDAVYSVPWEYMDTKNRKVVIFFLAKVQIPINLKAMGIVSVGVQTMAAILKNSFSYFMLLRTFATEV